MNTYQHELYIQLMELVESSEKKAFYYMDHEFNSRTYRIFNYRLASYTDFLQPSALECRGIMFRVEERDGQIVPVTLAAHPMPKFFNVNENPMTMELDFNNMNQIMDKADGSLISTFLDGPSLGVKSKASLSSQQAQDVRQFLVNSSENRRLLVELLDAAQLGFTVNMEWCAPHNRIVVGYSDPHLQVLNVRNNLDGTYVSSDMVKKHWPTIYQHWCQVFEIDHFGGDGESFVQSIDAMTGIEGFVLQLANGQFVKKKTEWYLVQHRAKDSINSPRRLFEAVLEEATDDLRTLVYDDPVAIKMIEEMEEKVEQIYNPIVAKIDDFVQTNGHLERKEYAILGQQTFTNKGEFGLAMQRYIGKEADVKEHLRKNYRNYGITDIAPDAIDE